MGWRPAGQLTDFNGAVLEGVTISVPERLTFTNTDGVDIDGFVMKPVGYEPGKRYPGIPSYSRWAEDGIWPGLPP